MDTQLVNAWVGDKVRLRSVRGEDWELFHENDEDTEAARLSWRIQIPRSPEAAQRWAADLAHSTSNDDHAFFAIQNLDGELVGSISSHSCNLRHGTFSYGLGIFRNHWRRGYAQDAIRILLRQFFEERGYRKANAMVYDFNEPSIKLHQRLGFQMEGRHRDMIFTGGEYHDEIHFGITRDEFYDMEGKLNNS